MRRCAVFDLDGTLADTSGDLIAAANLTLGGYGTAARLDPAADAAIALRGGKAMLRLGLRRLGREDEALVERLYPDLLGHYAANIAVATKLYPGAEDALDRLAAGGWALGVCTNKPEDLARLLLDALGVLGRFGALVGAGTLAVRKPAPEPVLETVRRTGCDPARAVMIGDTETDRDAARAAGLPVVLVGFGPAGPPDALGADAVAPSFRDLPGILERLRPGIRQGPGRWTETA